MWCRGRQMADPKVRGRCPAFGLWAWVWPRVCQNEQWTGEVAWGELLSAQSSV